MPASQVSRKNQGFQAFFAVEPLASPTLKEQRFPGNHCQYVPALDQNRNLARVKVWRNQARKSKTTIHREKLAKAANSAVSDQRAPARPIQSAYY